MKKNKKPYSFLRLTLIFTLIFAVIATAGFSVAINMMDGRFLGYNLKGSEEKAYLNCMFLGVDKDGYRTDVIIFGQLNLLNNTINLLQIPRDTYIANNGRYDKKINSAYSLEKEQTVFKEVNKLLGVEVEKYVLVDTKGFRKIIDAMGGVNYDVPINMNYDDPVQDLHIHLEKGYQLLDGDKAEQFVRFRQNNNGTGYARGDIERIEAQQGFIRAAIKQLFSITNAFKLPKVVAEFSDMIETNFTASEMLAYATYVLKVNMNSINIMALEGQAEYRGGVSYFVADEQKNKVLIQNYFTPGSETVNTLELEINNKIVGADSEEYSADDDILPESSLLNSFIGIDIIDASGGYADIDNIEQDLKIYNYRVKNVEQTHDLVYDKTKVVAKKSNGNGDKIANLLGTDFYVLNPEKEGPEITIIVGKDMEDY